MSNMTYSSNLRISVFLSVQRNIKRERKRDRKKKRKMVSHRRCDARRFQNQVPFPADAWIKLYYYGGAVQRERTALSGEGNFVETD